jgi:hypothetical protein
MADMKNMDGARPGHRRAVLRSGGHLGPEAEERFGGAVAETADAADALLAGVLLARPEGLASTHEARPPG